MRKQRRLGTIILNSVLICTFLAGAGIYAYPHVQNMRNQYQNKTTINNYDEQISKLSMGCAIAIILGVMVKRRKDSEYE